MLRKLKQRHRRRLIEGLRRAWRNYFPIGEKQDVAFLFGTIAFEVEHWKDARTWFHASVQQHGDGPAALHNIGLTLAKVDRWADALPWFQRALTAQRDYAPAAKFLGLAERVIEAEAEAGQIQGDVVVPLRADDADPNASSEE
jgi:tetratricopeptide (TPR) repeat protein